MTDILFHYDNFRVRDYDSLNYVVEERKVIKTGDNAGSETWRIRGYPTNGKGAFELLKRCIIQKSQAESKERAMAQISETNAEDFLSGLPKKIGTQPNNTTSNKDK